MRNVANWLEQLGLGQYANVFADNAIDLDILSELTDEDLERMGVLLGHRKRILREINAIPKSAGAAGRPAPATPNNIASNGGKPGSDDTALPRQKERRHLTVVFCDLVDSTPIAAKLDPEDFGEIISEFQSTCAKVISSFDGYTARFMGDGVLAYFGYPRAQEDDAGRAVRAALRLVEAVGLLKPKKLNERLRSRVGIATGLVVIDTLSGSAVSEQAAFGETPNLAARLQGAAEANSILIAESTFKLVSRQFIFSPEKTRQLKGIEKPVRTWTVISESAVESRFGSNHSEALTPFVGRIDEIELLVKLWERTKRPEGQVALISGEAGIGKSRLVEALHEALSNERHVAVRYQCSPYHTNSPLRPVINQIEFSAGFERDDNPQTRLAKLETFLNSSSAASNSDFALYGDLLSIPGAARHPIAEMTPRKSKELTISALIRYLLKLSESRPLLLIVEDAHWIDPTTLELLDRLIQDMHASKVYVLVTTRPDFVAPWGDLPNSTNIRLNRLSREHCAALLRNMTDGKELPIEVHEHIVSKTDGIPLFVEELTRTVLESGIMAEQDDRFTMSGALPTLAIPATLQDSLMSRLDRLGSSREIAQIGAALGRTFPHQLIAAVAPISEAALRNSLDQLTAADLIYRRGEPPDATYIFRHALVQDVAYESLLRSRRSQLHSRISDVLTGQFMQSVETEPEIMAHHLARAGRIEEAIAYLRKAGERAIRRSANVEAIRHLQRGLELLKQLPESSERQQVQLGIDVILGQALIAGRGYAASETRDVLLRAKELLHVLTEPSDRFAVLYGIWACYYVGGEVRLQQAAASEFLAAAEKADDTAALCIAHRALGTTYVTMGEFATGRWHLEQARSLYDPDRHLRFRYQYGQDIGTTALCYLCWALWHLGQTQRASEVAREAIAYAEKLDHPHTTAYAVCHARGMMDMFRRDASETVAYTDEVIALCNEHGFPFWAAGAQIMNGWAKCKQGQIEDGIATLESGLNKWRRTGARLWLPMFLASEAEACAAVGKLDQAMEGIEQAIEVASETGERWAMAEILRIKAELVLAIDSGARAQAEKLLLESMDIARAQQARSFQLRTACDLARLWQLSERTTEAAALLRESIGQFSEHVDSADMMPARSLLNSITAGNAPRTDTENVRQAQI